MIQNSGPHDALASAVIRYDTLLDPDAIPTLVPERVPIPDLFLSSCSCALVARVVDVTVLVLMCAMGPSFSGPEDSSCSRCARGPRREDLRIE